MKLKDWFKEPPPKKSRMGVRHPAPHFVVLHPPHPSSEPEKQNPIEETGDSLKQDPIKDISATGIYILTEDRWEKDAHVPLTLHRTNQQDENSSQDFTLPATAVRNGEDGMGLRFDLPQDIDPPAWVSLVEGACGEAGPNTIVDQFKMAEATTFLSRICPNAEKDFRRRICNDLSSGRFKHAIEIALKAEKILAGWPDAAGMSADPTLLARILEFGSWAEEDRTQQQWAGIFAIACAPEKDNETNLDLVERLGQFATIHFKIFTKACEAATKVLSDTGTVSAKPLRYTTDQVLKIVGSRDLGRVERELQHLHDLGLFVSENVPSSYLPVDELDLAPTNLGLKIFAKFHAHRGSPEAFYGLAAPVRALETTTGQTL